VQSACTERHYETVAVIFVYLQMDLNEQQSLQQLLALGFSEERSQEAIRSIGASADIQLYVNWLFDHGEDDKGGAVQFKHCEHLDDNSKALVAYSELHFAPDIQCRQSECTSSNGVWLCLACNTPFCGRYGQRHGVQHREETGHATMMSFDDLSIWCYDCDSYVEHPRLGPLRAKMEYLKFGGLAGDIAPMRAQILPSLDLEGLARFIAEQEVKNILVMSGAGVSTAAGIPDFRTPGSGLYDNLQRFKLSKPEDMFTIQFFRENPDPFYELCKEMWPGKHTPTASHYFILLLHKKGLLRRCYTQNIDSLETLAGLPSEKLVAAHGNFDEAHVCPQPLSSPWREQPEIDVPIAKMQAAVEAGKSGLDALNAEYGGKCKPRIVFFGEGLPKRFDLAEADFPQCDLLLVMGTSLVVQPFAGLVAAVGEDVPRLLINREMRGLDGCQGLEGGFRFHLEEQNYRDVFSPGMCDDGCRNLATLLGWESDLEALIQSGGHAPITRAPWIE